MRARLRCSGWCSRWPCRPRRSALAAAHGPAAARVGRSRRPTRRAPRRRSRRRAGTSRRASRSRCCGGSTVDGGRARSDAALAACEAHAARAGREPAQRATSAAARRAPLARTDGFATANSRMLSNLAGTAGPDARPAAGACWRCRGIDERARVTRRDIDAARRARRAVGGAARRRSRVDPRRSRARGAAGSRAQPGWGVDVQRAARPPDACRAQRA